MTNLVPERLPALRAHHFPGLPQGEHYLYPHYAGNSIMNVPDTVCRLMNVPEISARPLDAALYAPLGNGIQRVITILVDALALHRLQRWMNDGTAPVWQEVMQAGVLAPLTSISPSTTCAALTSLWTGRSPTEHGIAGYELWLKEYGVVANMILHNPIQFRGLAGSLESAGFDPKTYLSFPTLGAHLKAYGVKTYAFQHYSLGDSGLSQMFLKDVEMRPWGSPAELWANMRQTLEAAPQERMYLWVYWSGVDSLSHRYGPDDERAAGDFSVFSAAFERHFWRPLQAAARKDTAILLLADHGQIDTPPDPHYQLRTYPDLDRRLHINPTGEHRLFFVYPRPGQREAVQEYLERTWRGQFRVFDSLNVLNSGLYGPGQVHPALRDRLGDLTVLPDDHAYLWWPYRDDPLRGRHGGLHPEEMLVPFLAARLG
ncbi:MAG: alkaline phosphatase family protein [Anaerolineales bacterium]